MINRSSAPKPATRQGSFTPIWVASDMTGVTQDEIFALVSLGKIPSDTVRGRMFVSLDAVQAIAAERGDP